MSEIAATTAYEAYAFACMRCGYGWEQAYEIEHHIDGSHHAFVIYKADGEQVPSPLSRPSCANCGGHVVRIMRAGRVSTVQQMLRHAPPARRATAGGDAPEAVGATAVPAATGHRWHLSDLLHPFHRR
ncbi:hypothetical protein ACFVWY_21105 [Streptomyces sp. NPDC058195]|uniref:hypothetical protein n=1 Tax=Streptomyces sp. NPDC058195 TaxID=3346375 RepID=UPI0036F057AF